MRTTPEASSSKLILEGGDDTKVPAAAQHAPEQVRVLRDAGREELAVGCDEIDREEIVAGQAVPPC